MPALLWDGQAQYNDGLSERRGGQSLYRLEDVLGSTRQMVDASGSSSNGVTDEYLWDSFGNPTHRWNRQNGIVSGQPFGANTPSPFRYAGNAGYQSDADTGFQLLGHRYYDPGIGRFLSRDPAKSGENWYAYCNNDPVNNADPLGLQSNGPSVNGRVLDGHPDGVDEDGLPYYNYPGWAGARIYGPFPHGGAWYTTFTGPDIASAPRALSRIDYNDVPLAPPSVNLRANVALAKDHLHTQVITQGDFASSYVWFAWKVRPGGEWDYNTSQTALWYGINRNNDLPQYENFGNFNYGATGAALGISLETLLRTAGGVQWATHTNAKEWGNPFGSPPFGDQPEDQHYIKSGYHYYQTIIMGGQGR